MARSACACESAAAYTGNPGTSKIAAMAGPARDLRAASVTTTY
jgi:hypothetical protein